MVSEKSRTSTSISTAIAASSPAKEAVSAKKSSGRLLLLRCAASARRLRATRPGLLEAARYAGPLLPEDRPARWRAELNPIPILSLQHSACDVYDKFDDNQYVGGPRRSRQLQGVPEWFCAPGPERTRRSYGAGWWARIVVQMLGKTREGLGHRSGTLSRVGPGNTDVCGRAGAAAMVEVRLMMR